MSSSKRVVITMTRILEVPAGEAEEFMDAEFENFRNNPQGEAVRMVSGGLSGDLYFHVSGGREH